ncbi:MAG: livF 2 [Solirubrobacterales bacterium]|nr:livF 2 [Solirubrobacterales bacterium]
MSAPLLLVDGLTVTYGRAVALEDVSLRLDDGDAVALVGANGAGKTTLLRTITGLLRFHAGVVRSGTMRFGGRPAGGAPPTLVRLGLAQTLEGRRVFADLTVEENLRIGAISRGRAERRQTTDAMIELFPRLGERLTQPAGLLSGGEQQMLAIARALMSKPRLLLMDEPSLGLAPRVVGEIGSALRRINERGTAILLVDQSTALAMDITTSAALLQNGRIVARGATAQMLADDQVRASYLGTTAATADLGIAKAGA